MNGPGAKYPSVAQLTQLLETRTPMYNAPWSIEAESPPASPRPTSPTGFKPNNRLQKMLAQSYGSIGRPVPKMRRAATRKGRKATRKSRRVAYRKGRIAYRKSRRAYRKSRKTNHR